MAKDLRLSTESQNEMVDAITPLADNGYIRIYSGTRPTDANTAVGAQVLLAELRFGNPAFGAAVAGVATANAITSDNDADATGVASWFRALKADGTSALFDGTVGMDGVFDLVVANTQFVENAQIAITSLTYTHPAS